MMKHQALPSSDIEVVNVNKPIGVSPAKDYEANAPAYAITMRSNVGYEPITPPNSPVIITWENLTVTTIPKRGQEPKKLLNNLSGTISGGLWAIMGGSGSGKTTFLSTLALRTNRMRTEGKVLLNGREYDKALLKAMSGYVMQDDLLISTLTVEETLAYTALLRTPKNLSQEERSARQNSLLEMLGIDHVKHVRVGDTRNKGISGGERKRLCVAMELLCRPSLLFLDEPTSGEPCLISYF
jgi:ATP-binding cassette, subfamily G (WHITE), member 2